MTPQEVKELEQLRKEKAQAEAKRLEMNKKSAEWHRRKREAVAFAVSRLLESGSKEDIATYNNILHGQN